MQPTILAFTLLVLLTPAALQAASDATLLAVDIDPAAGADFTSIQAAIDAIPLDNRRRVVVRVADGLYHERLRLDQDRVTVRGESRHGVRIAFHAPRSEYDRRYDKIGPAVVNVFGDDVVLENLTIENTQTSREHAFAIYGQPDRMILRDCDVLSEGGDTVSLWNTPFGRYYHAGCRFRGGVDFVCPRGWCFVRDCDFECPTTSAALWHDGHMDHDMKFVLRDCRFDGIEQFWIGRNHYPSQFYLLDCHFSERLADKPIEVVKELAPGEDPSPYQRKYFHNCDRDGGDYAWMRDNLDSAAGSPKPEAISPTWTFGGTWDPESQAPPTVIAVEAQGDAVMIDFSEPVAGAEASTITRADGSVARFESEDGMRRLFYRGGAAGSPPRRLAPGADGALYGTVATLDERFVPAQELPPASPPRRVKVLIVGDSTVAAYSKDHGYQGWGARLQRMFDGRVTVENRGRGGRSSKSYRDEGHWAQALATGPDVVLIQFGHNDNPGKGPERETDPAPGGDFRANLRRYVAEARAAGATPVLVTPPTRRSFDPSGRIPPNEPNTPYAEATLAVAEELKIAAIDLNRLTRDLFENLGEAGSAWLQPEGDRTHFTPSGAYRVAALVAAPLSEAAPQLKPMLDPDALRASP